VKSKADAFGEIKSPPTAVAISLRVSAISHAAGVFHPPRKGGFHRKKHIPCDVLFSVTTEQYGCGITAI